ncbi:hypothetical protein COT48_04425 [Candidatus Woesearchaeota archaeon CG08_land_8_20_14_0_20_47_9]|nr:MAG: hypothetical protein COT48_04425 [Candidatus Woesearchaeota archaeon CG08_land_8_20_14_0_20_47_9]
MREGVKHPIVTSRLNSEPARRTVIIKLAAANPATKDIIIAATTPTVTASRKHAALDIISANQHGTQKHPSKHASQQPSHKSITSEF